jgi:putative MFS transporter
MSSTASVAARLNRLPVRALFEPAWRRRTAMLWIFQCLQTFGYYGFGTLVPLVLAAKGFDIVTCRSSNAWSGGR